MPNGNLKKPTKKDIAPPDQTALEKIRPELNLEKWSIWKPSHSTRTERKREEVFERERILEDGSKEKAQVIVRASGNLDLFTTEDQRTYYALIKLWEEKGKSTDYVPFSLRKIAKLKKKKWHKDTLNEIIDSLGKLASITFRWNYSFYDSTKDETLHSLEWFHILSSLKIAYRTKGDKVDCRPVGYFHFHDLILKNLLNNHTKPLYLDVILKFKSEIAQILYTHIDLIMSDKTHYERRSEGLFKDLGLEGRGYIYPSIRKQKLEPALKELQGVELSTGTLIEAKLEPTKDEKDYKVVFKKKPEKQYETKASSEAKEPILIPRADLKAEELVRYFHEKLYQPEHQATAKELDQATSLIAHCGYEQAKYIIDYAIREAEKTNFQMKTFGAIFQYQSEALAKYEQYQKDKQRYEQLQCQQEEEERQQREREAKEIKELDDLYNSLPDDQKQKINLLIDKRFKKIGIGINYDPSSNFYQAFLGSAKYHVLKEFKQNPELLNNTGFFKDQKSEPEQEPETKTEN